MMFFFSDFSMKTYIVNIGYSLKVPLIGASTEYPQITTYFVMEKKEKYCCIIKAPDEIEYQENIFLISPLKHMLWALIRSASVKCF